MRSCAGSDRVPVPRTMRSGCCSGIAGRDAGQSRRSISRAALSPTVSWHRPRQLVRHGFVPWASVRDKPCFSRCPIAQTLAASYFGVVAIGAAAIIVNPVLTLEDMFHIAQLSGATVSVIHRDVFGRVLPLRHFEGMRLVCAAGNRWLRHRCLTDGVPIDETLNCVVSGSRHDYAYRPAYLRQYRPAQTDRAPPSRHPLRLSRLCKRRP